MAVRINMIANILSYRYTWNIFAVENFIASPIQTPKTERDTLLLPLLDVLSFCRISPPVNFVSN